MELNGFCTMPLSCGAICLGNCRKPMSIFSDRELERNEAFIASVYAWTESNGTTPDPKWVSYLDDETPIESTCDTENPEYCEACQ